MRESAAACPEVAIGGGFYAAIDPASGAVGLALIRGQMRDWLTGAGLGDPHLHQLLIAVGEATNNAVEHSGAEHSGEHPPAWVEANCEPGRVRVKVADRGRWQEPDTDQLLTRRRGRGRLMMTNLVDHLSIRTDHTGTTVELVKEFSPTAMHSRDDSIPSRGVALRPRSAERLRITRGAAGEVLLAGEVDQATARKLRIALQEVAAEPIIMVDLCAVHHLQSAGVGVLYENLRGNLHLRVRADSAVATVLRICGLSQIVPVEFVAPNS